MGNLEQVNTQKKKINRDCAWQRTQTAIQKQNGNVANSTVLTQFYCHKWTLTLSINCHDEFSFATTLKTSQISDMHACSTRNLAQNNPRLVWRPTLAFPLFEVQYPSPWLLSTMFLVPQCSFRQNTNPDLRSRCRPARVPSAVWSVWEQSWTCSRSRRLPHPNLGLSHPRRKTVQWLWKSTEIWNTEHIWMWKEQLSACNDVRATTHWKHWRATFDSTFDVSVHEAFLFIQNTQMSMPTVDGYRTHLGIDIGVDGKHQRRVLCSYVIDSRQHKLDSNLVKAHSHQSCGKLRWGKSSRFRCLPTSASV